MRTRSVATTVGVALHVALGGKGVALGGTNVYVGVSDGNMGGSVSVGFGVYVAGGRCVAVMNGVRVGGGGGTGLGQNNSRQMNRTTTMNSSSISRSVRLCLWYSFIETSPRWTVSAL